MWREASGRPCEVKAGLGAQAAGEGPFWGAELGPGVRVLEQSWDAGVRAGTEVVMAAQRGTNEHGHFRRWSSQDRGLAELPRSLSVGAQAKWPAARGGRELVRLDSGVCTPRTEEAEPPKEAEPRTWGRLGRKQGQRRGADWAPKVGGGARARVQGSPFLPAPSPPHDP